MFFKKNPNETAYVGGKKHFADVIKNSGPGELMVWRQPEEDFNTNSTLIVMPGEEAIFINGGKIEQVFENGTYKLSTQNYPFISRLRNAFTGGISAFNCVVYFVRKAHSEEIRWGTDSPIQVRDKLLGIATKLKCRGAYKVCIDDPGRFLEKLIGSNIPFGTQEELNKYFISEFQSKIKSVIARAINDSDEEILGIDSRLDELSETIKPHMDNLLGEYGLKCAAFVVSAIDVDDDELRRRYDEIGMDAIATMRKAHGDKAAMDILGENWGKQQAADIMREVAKNPGAGGVGAMGAGMGMGIAAGSAFGGLAGQMMSPMGESAPKAEDPFETLARLKKMLDAGLIEQAEYDAKKADILKRI